MANFYIIAGCNGAGKTTASFTLLPEMLNCREFVNADEIARGLSPFQPEAAAFPAGRIMLERIDELMKSGVDFAIETTLSTKSYVGLVRKAQALGYKVSMVYFWLNSPQMAVDRVRRRVAQGGHHIPEDVIHRRYQRGIGLLINTFVDVVDKWLVYDNSDGSQELIAAMNLEKKVEIYSAEKWQQLKMISNGF